MHLIDLPWLDVAGSETRKPENRHGKVTDDRIRASAVLFVEAARQNLFPLCQTVDGGLVGKKNFFAGAEVERTAKESGFADAGEIQEQNARIQVVDPEEAAAVVVARPAELRAPEVDCKQVGDVGAENCVGVKIDQLRRHFGNAVGIEPQEGIGGILRVLVRRIRKRFEIVGLAVHQTDAALRVGLSQDIRQQVALFLRDGSERRIALAQIHGKEEEIDRSCVVFDDRQRADDHAVENLCIAAEQNGNSIHVRPPFFSRSGIFQNRIPLRARTWRCGYDPAGRVPVRGREVTNRRKKDRRDRP